MKGRCLVVIARYTKDETSDCVSFPLSGEKVAKVSTADQSHVYNGQHENVQYCLDVCVASYFRSELTRSCLFKKHVWAHYSTQAQNKTVIVQIILTPPTRYQLDHRL